MKEDGASDERDRSSAPSSMKELEPSVTRRGESRIVPYLKEGAGVVTTRAHVHYVVTEFGTAKLFGKNLRERAEALIKIAHPDHQDEILAAAKERKLLT